MPTENVRWALFNRQSISNFFKKALPMRTWCLWIGLTGFLTGSAQAADEFDRQTTADLVKALEAGSPLKQLTIDDSARIKPLSATVSSPCLIFRTDEGNLTKALVAWGLRKGPEKPTPVLLIERYVTYRVDRPDLTAATGTDVMLFPGFQFNFDIGQVVPDQQGGDIAFTAESVLKPLDNVQMLPLPGVPKTPDGTAKSDRPGQDGNRSQQLAGTWIVDADGRWKGEWELQVAPNGRITGTYTAEGTKNRYEINGQNAAATHNAHFNIYLANAEMAIDAYLWTTDQNTMAGTVAMAGRTFGFIAHRAKKE